MSRKALVGTTVAALIVAITAAPVEAQEAVARPDLWPASHSPAVLTAPTTETRIRDLLSSMTLEEKVGQLIQADIASG